MHVVSDKWGDGSWWELDLPEEWQVTERSVQHVRLANKDSRALLGIGKDGKLEKYSGRLSPPNVRDPSEQEVWAYTCATALTFTYSLLSRGGTEVEKNTFGNLTGYTIHQSLGAAREMWAGYLYGSGWSVYVNLEATPRNMTKHRQTVIQVLKSIVFRA